MAFGPFLATVLASQPKSKGWNVASTLRELGMPPRIAAALAAPAATTQRHLFDMALRLGLDPTEAFQFFLNRPHCGNAMSRTWDAPHWEDTLAQDVTRMPGAGLTSFTFTGLDLQGRKIRLPETLITNWAITLNPNDFDFSQTRFLAANNLHFVLEPGSHTILPASLELALGWDLAVLSKDRKSASPSIVPGCLTLEGRVRTTHLAVHNRTILKVSHVRSAEDLRQARPSDYWLHGGTEGHGDILPQWAPQP
jgi:hypothetical protein